MKQIMNILADAFRSIGCEEFPVTLLQEGRFLVVTIKDSEGKKTVLDICYEDDGYIANISVLTNELLDHADLRAFVQTIYRAEFVYV